METISFNGESYVKASAIARELGYTADYVGQLCRSGKVDAELVGRSWYVGEASIRSHKKLRYRSSVTKATKDVKREVEKVRTSFEEASAEKPKLQRKSRFYDNAYVESVYTDDVTDLIPTFLDPSAGAEGSRQIAVNLGDANTVSVRQEGAEYDISTPKLPELRLRGTLSITDEAAREEDEMQKQNILQPSEAPKKKEFKRRTYATVPVAMKKPKQILPMFTATQIPVTESLEEPVAEVTLIRRIGYVSMQLITSILLALAVSTFILGLEARTVVEEGYTSSSLSFNMSAVIGSQ